MITHKSSPFSYPLYHKTSQMLKILAGKNLGLVESLIRSVEGFIAYEIRYPITIP
tara:strand:+ start:972 stop:1136 length:165 start_codon:yes stop_codon:yes gene_type:complete